MPENFFYNLILFYPIFLFSLTVHEYAHAITANWGGDLTSTYQDRLTLNPSYHVDIIGSIILPIAMIAMSGMAYFGWARPVPVNEANFRDKTWNVVVTLAGPFSNLLLVLLGGFLMSLIANIYVYGADRAWWALNQQIVNGYFEFVHAFIFMNVLMMIFNLLPIPPLDGSHLFYHFFIRGRGKYYEFWDNYQRFGLIILILVVFRIPFLFDFINGVYVTLYWIFKFPYFNELYHS